VRVITVITVRVEPNRQGSHIIWNVRAEDGTEAHGFAKSPADAMRDAAAFVEAMMQPRLGGLWKRPELRVVEDNP
jgi:hypothetical protein